MNYKQGATKKNISKAFEKVKLILIDKKIAHKKLRERLSKAVFYLYLMNHVYQMYLIFYIDFVWPEDLAWISTKTFMDNAFLNISIVCFLAKSFYYFTNLKSTNSMHMHYVKEIWVFNIWTKLVIFLSWRNHDRINQRCWYILRKYNDKINDPHILSLSIQSCTIGLHSIINYLLFWVFLKKLINNAFA